MEIVLHTSPFSVSLGAELLALAKEIFTSLDEHKFFDRLARPDGLMAVAAKDGRLAGFKMGYRESDTTVYSWLGGVRPDFRGHGLGQRLMDAQHAHCRAHGYRYVKTKTMNRWRAMLILNLKNGFDITQTYLSANGEQKIILIKPLT